MLNKKQRSNDTKTILLELVAIGLLATGGIWVKYSSLGPINTGFYRVLLSIPILYPFARQQLKELSRKEKVYLFSAGIFLAGDIALWNLSFHYTTVANANLLTNLTPLTVIPISCILFKEKIPKFFFWGALLTFLGVFLLIGGKVNPSEANYFGDFLAFSASFFYAGFLLISYHLRDKTASSTIMFMSALGTVSTLFFISLFTEGFQVPESFSEFLPLLGLAICLQVIGHNLLAHCQGKINVNLSSIICLFQPVVASVYAFLFFAEKLTVKEFSAIILVLLGIYSVKMQYGSQKN